MAPSTNSIVLFVGGVVLGVLLSLSLLSRFQQSAQLPTVVLQTDSLQSNTPNHGENTSKYALHTSISSISTSTVKEEGITASAGTSSNPLDQFLAASRRKRSKVGAEAIPTLMQAESTRSETQVDFRPSATPVAEQESPPPPKKMKSSAATRWTPGRADQTEKYIAAAAVVTEKSPLSTSSSSSSSNTVPSELQEKYDLPRDSIGDTGTDNGMNTDTDGPRGKRKNKQKERREKKREKMREIKAANGMVDNTGSASVTGVVRPLDHTPGQKFAYLEPQNYHNQVSRDFPNYRPFVPSYQTALDQSVLGNGSVPAVKLPDVSQQRGDFEKDNLKIHLCNAQHEAYSASYLTTKAHMLHVNSEGYNLTWVNCEMASFIHMKESNRHYKNPDSEGVIMQSLDVLDFSVIHLSAYERSTHKHRNVLFKSQKEMKDNWHKIDPVIHAGQELEKLNSPKSTNKRKINYSPEALRTVVVMPFLGGAMGAGHSKLGNRFEYLKTCIWSFYEFIPNIVPAVSRQEDVDWAMKESGLPFREVLLLPSLPKSAGLPVGTTQQVRKRLTDGRWDFDYIFFTESDQILISRELQLMYNHLKTYPGHMMIPHRLMPYSSDVIDKVFSRSSASIEENKWMTQSCCMKRQNCVNRKDWKFLKDRARTKDEEVAIISYYGLYVPLGNVNFLQEQYRTCSLSDYVGDYCP